MSENELRYREILFRLIDKVKRNGDYYRQIAHALRNKTAYVDDDIEHAKLTAQIESLGRCALDMDFTVDKALHRLTGEEIQEIMENYVPPKKRRGQKDPET